MNMATQSEFERLKKIMAITPGNIYWKDKDGRYLGCNNNQLKVAGVSATTDIIGKTDYDLYTKEIADPVREDDELVMAAKVEKIFEEEGVNTKGEKAIYLTKKMPMFSDDNEVIGIIGISIDITAQKAAEERENLALMKEAEARGKAEAEEQLRQAVTVISGSIAHDLRTPLGILDMSAERLKKYMPALVEAYHKAEEAHLITEKLQGRLLDNFAEIGGMLLEETHEMKEFITASLKTLSKAIAGDTSAESLTLCSMDKCIDQTIRRYPYVGEEHKLVKWDRKADFKFMGNEILMIRILFNLIKNSLEQIKQNKRGEIFITTEMGEKENVLHVKDTAGGAPPEIVEHLFDGYKTTKKEGTGVGLAFCKKLMQDFGGNITCHSEYGNFIEFVLTFPKVTEKSQSNDKK
jgi:PAS domain S-box-containing protein